MPATVKATNRPLPLGTVESTPGAASSTAEFCWEKLAMFLLLLMAATETTEL